MIMYFQLTSGLDVTADAYGPPCLISYQSLLVELTRALLPCRLSVYKIYNIQSSGFKFFLSQAL